jgi:hypothetical protein
MKILEFPEIYGSYVRCALMLQVLCGILTAAIMDGGIIAFCYLFVCIFFWIIAGVYMFFRKHPTMIECLLIGSGPLLIFLAPFIPALFF